MLFAVSLATFMAKASEGIAFATLTISRGDDRTKNKEATRSQEPFCNSLHLEKLKAINNPSSFILRQYVRYDVVEGKGGKSRVLIN